MIETHWPSEHLSVSSAALQRDSCTARLSLLHVLNRDGREWPFTFPLPPIPMQSIPIPSHSHSHFCDYSHFHPIPMDLFPFPFPCSGPKYYELTSNLCENKPSLLKTAIQSYANSVSFFHVLLVKHYRKKR